MKMGYLTNNNIVQHGISCDIITCPFISLYGRSWLMGPVDLFPLNKRSRLPSCINIPSPFIAIYNAIMK